MQEQYIIFITVKVGAGFENSFWKHSKTVMISLKALRPYQEMAPSTGLPFWIQDKNIDLITVATDFNYG